jgi:transposase
MIAMRGKRDNQGKMFFTIDVEARVRADHPLRSLKRMVDRHLHSLQERFETAYARTGRPSVPPERLLKALLLQALYSIRSEPEKMPGTDPDQRHNDRFAAPC